MSLKLNLRYGVYIKKGWEKMTTISSSFYDILSFTIKGVPNRTVPPKTVVPSRCKFNLRTVRRTLSTIYPRVLDGGDLWFRLALGLPSLTTKTCCTSLRSKEDWNRVTYKRKRTK